MKNFPGVIDEPQKPVGPEKAAPQAAKPESTPTVPDFETFFESSFPHGFTPSGVMLRSGVDELLGGEIDDDQWEFIAGYVSAYVSNVLNPVIAGLVQNASSHYVKQRAAAAEADIVARFKEMFGGDVNIFTIKDEEDDE